MEISLSSLVIGEMTIKPNEILKHLHYKGYITKCWRGWGATENLIYFWWECKVVQSLWKTDNFLCFKIHLHLT